MYKYTKVQFIERKDYYDVIVYYSKNGDKFRPATGVKISFKNLLPSGTISSKHPNYDEDLEKIKVVQDRVENLVHTYKNKYGEKPPVEWLEKEMNKEFSEAKKDLSDALCFWDEFIKEKEQTVRAEGTINKYNNCKSVINAFCKKKNFNLTFSTLDQQFFNDFALYLVSEHEYLRGNQSKFNSETQRPEVGLSNSTAISRLKDFKEYIQYCIVEHDVDLKIEKIKKFIEKAKHKFEVKDLGKTNRWELTLTPDEINFVVNLDHRESDYWENLSENQKRYIDIILFMSLQGTAPIDTKSIGRTDVRNGKIIKERSKTGNEFAVELHPVAEIILDRNDYNLDFTDQTLNDELKKIFVTIFSLYAKHYENKYKEPYELVACQKVKKGDRIINKIQHKGLFVEAMTGRRSFITNLCAKAEELGIKETMDRVGHVKINTTMGYIHLSKPTKSNRDLFGISRMK